MTSTGYQGFSGDYQGEDSLAGYSGEDSSAEEGSWPGYSGEEDSAEDSETVSWVDETLAEAEQGGFLEELGVQVESNTFADTTGFATVVEQARTSSGETAEAPQMTADRAAIREAIFAKLRRPDGAPFAAGYTSGPAARKAMYQGEDTGAGWRIPQAPKNNVFTTVYEGRDTIGERASGVDTQGRVLDANGQPVVDGQWGWVIDEETGYLLLFDPAYALVVNRAGAERPMRADETIPALFAAGYKFRFTHHTTPVAGMPVTGAGIMRIENGFIAEITDQSGHYRPEAPQQYAALQALMDQGYSFEQAKVRLTGQSMGQRPTDKAEWLNEAGPYSATDIDNKGNVVQQRSQTNPYFPTDDVTLRPEQFMQTQGDEYQIRLKQALNRQIEEPSGAESHISTEEDATTEEERDSTEEERDSTEQDGDASVEDTDAAFVAQARGYLASAGRSAFAEWFRTLSQEHQNLLLADPEIGLTWRAENAASTPGWQPADSDRAAAATANAAFVDSLDDRQSAVFELGGFSLIIGDGHDERHLAYVQDAPDHVTGRVTVRKAAVGRGAGSLTFVGVPPAKQSVVQDEVARFSRKEVRFGS